MASFAKLIFLVFTAIVAMMSSNNIALMNAMKAKSETNREINKITLDQVKELEVARNNFYRVYKRYPDTIEELVNAGGMIRSTFSTSKYSKDISIDPVTKKIVLATDQDRIQRNMALGATAHISQAQSNKNLVTADTEAKRTANIKDFLSKKDDLNSLETTVSNSTNLDDAVNRLNVTTEQSTTDLYNDLTADQMKLLNQTVGY